MSNHAMAAGWQLEGDSADAYERYLAAAFVPWAVRMTDLAEVRPGDRVLDVACGTGIVARHAAMRTGSGGRVVGVDINDDMLRVARAASAGAPPVIEWRQADAAALPFSEGTFDVVTCQQALQFFADPVAALAGMRRVMDRDGRLVVSVCRPLAYAPTYRALGEVLDRHAGRDAGTMMRSPFSSWDTGRFRALFLGAGFEAVRVLIEASSLRYSSCEEFLRREASSSPLAQAVRILSPQKLAGLVDDLRHAVGDHLDDDGVLCPLELYIAVAHR